jgi:predicted nuclease of predicted toxin-antitoxin system
VKLWADACVTPTLEAVAHARGYEATSNRTRGMLSTLDPNLYPIVAEEDWVFITNNEKDFRDLASEAQLHPGLVILPQSTVAKQRQSLDEVITYIEAQAAKDDESPADWMVCRIVAHDGAGEGISHAWLPEPGS